MKYCRIEIVVELEPPLAHFAIIFNTPSLKYFDNATASAYIGVTTMYDRVNGKNWGLHVQISQSQKYLFAVLKYHVYNLKKIKISLI